MSLQNFGEKEIYNLTRIGNYGQFVTGNSLPIEYVLTSFLAHELSFLTFARDIHPQAIDFELLMQRNIDEERVRLEMTPYLNPGVTPVSQFPLTFFPPLLAAIVPMGGKTMKNYYPKESGDIIYGSDSRQKEIKHLVRTWEALFKLSYFPSHHNPPLHQIPLSMPSGKTEIGVQYEPVKLELYLTDKHFDGVKLVIIDGQHRLFSLLQVYEQSPDLLEKLSVPVCILFAPFASLADEPEASTRARIPTVSEVFRRVFVDINSTAKRVGGHFNILLSDDSIPNLTCRHFCDEILTKRGNEALAVIEWDTQTKSNLNSSKMVRSYSLSSVSILNQALEGCLAKRQALLDYLLQLQEVNELLYPVFNQNDTSANLLPIQWNQFSLSQKSILEGQVRKHLIPCLEMLLFDNPVFIPAFDIFCHHLGKLQQVAKSQKKPQALEAELVLNQILYYIPLKEGQLWDSVHLLYRQFESDIVIDTDKQCFPLFQYALFQRALLEAWAQVLEVARTEIAIPSHATKGFLKLVDLACQQQNAFFHFEQPYMQYTVFFGNQFLVKEETTRFLTHLFLAHLANPSYTEQVVHHTQVDNKQTKVLATVLMNKGNQAAKKIPTAYTNAIKRYFKKNYRFNLSLDSQTREEMMQAEEEQKRHRQEVKDGLRDKKAVSKRFDQLIMAHLEPSIQRAIKVFKQSLFMNPE